MVPGGELLDGASLLREAVDYVVHLRAQVAVLRRVANAVQHMAGTFDFSSISSYVCVLQSACKNTI
jgi:hypothetical protein